MKTFFPDVDSVPPSVDPLGDLIEICGGESSLRASRAAPEMLAALKDLVALDDWMNAEDNEDSGTYLGAYYAYYKGESAKWSTARTAIAKAEGRASE